MMEYPFITLDDSKQIVQSEMLVDHRIKVCIVKDALHCAICLLPDQSWMEVVGFNEDEVQR